MKRCKNLSYKQLSPFFDNDSNSTQVNLTGVSMKDSLFLQSWLHGRSKKTVQAYLADILRFYERIGKPLQTTTLEDFHYFMNILAHWSPACRPRVTATVKTALPSHL